MTGKQNSLRFPIRKRRWSRALKNDYRFHLAVQILIQQNIEMANIFFGNSTEISYLEDSILLKVFFVIRFYLFESIHEILRPNS